MRIIALLALLAASTALAQESLEKVVVRNRLYTVGGKFELGANVGFTMVDALTTHTNFTLDLAYNVSDAFGFELLGGYAYSKHTGLADQISTDVMAATVSPSCGAGACGWPTVVNDMANLWEMKTNAIAGIRWSPIYGKIGLLAEIPVHFQAYVWLGGGVGQFSRTSVVYCLNRAGPGVNQGDCNTWENEQKVTWIGSAAFGLKLFLAEHHAIKLEARNYLWPDSYLIDIDRRIGEANKQTGVQASSPGVTNLVLLDVGYTYVF